ncbi:MAG: YdeI/OmpD-associated family protein [Gemmatimonadaceae bacterium]
MTARDPRIDAYIAKSADFAKPILTHLRAVVHSACPEVEETTKWSAPFFMYKGVLCSMAAFKEHCVFGFWKGSLIVDKNGGRVDEAAGQFGRITMVSDLPSKTVLAGYIKAAMKLNEDGVKSPARAKPKGKDEPVSVPPELAGALKKNKKAHATFEAFTASKKREYTEWIGSAKGDATRARRLEQAIEWMSEGKSRNWKYINC